MSNELKACPTPRCHGVIFTLELKGGIGFKACCAGCEMTGPRGGSVCESTEFWNEMPRKIKLTKTLPSEVGRYFWCSDDIDLMIVDVTYSKYSYDKENIGQDAEFLVSEDHNEMGHIRVELMGGYWAKVEQDQFELEG
jgi:hypothetical protein